MSAVHGNPVNRWSGGCICRSVRYVCTGEPARVTICHCLWCQRRTGSAFGTEVVFVQEKVSLCGIEPTKYRHVSDESGRWLEVYFCPRCGSNLGCTLQAVPGIRTVPAGTLDEPGMLDPKQVKFRHVFTRSRRTWSDLTSEVEAYERHFRA
jgi:hypothetical protein